MKPAISVCVPTYNGEAYLAESLDSILAQTFGDFEVLVVDDCSRDGTVAVAERYAALDPRVRVIRNERNLGLVGNWNRCLELASGEWIKFVFQDDLIAPTCLERMLAVAQDGWMLVSCARDFVFDPDTRESDREFYRWHQSLVASLLSEAMTAAQFGELTLDHVDTNIVGEPTVVMFHRSVPERFGAFNAYMVQDVDSEYWARVGSAVGVAHIGDLLATFRVHATSATSHNVRTRYVRTQLDRLIIRHDYAFAAAYASLRAICRSRRPGRDLEREFWRAAYATLLVDGGTAALADSSDRERAEVERVYSAYPRLRDLPRHYRARYAVSRFLTRHRAVGRAYMLAKSATVRIAARRQVEA